jgi:uncharacterized protein (TIGR02598 family)
MKTRPAPPQTSLPTRRNRGIQKAFSLIETALALGIVAFAFVGLMGMLPAGLATFRKAMDTTVSAQIVQRIVSDAEQSDFDNLSADAASSNPNFYIMKTRYFDDQGSEVITAGGATPNSADLLKILYHVRVRGSIPGLPDSTLNGTGNFTSLPDTNPGARFHPRDSTFLTIQIANNPSNKTLTVDTQQLWNAVDAKKAGVSITTQSAVVTRNGPKKKTP